MHLEEPQRFQNLWLSVLGRMYGDVSTANKDRRITAINWWQHCKNDVAWICSAAGVRFEQAMEAAQKKMQQTVTARHVCEWPHGCDHWSKDKYCHGHRRLMQRRRATGKTGDALLFEETITEDPPLQRFELGDRVHWHGIARGVTLHNHGEIVRILGPEDINPYQLATDLYPDYIIKITPTKATPTLDVNGRGYFILVRTQYGRIKKPRIYMTFPSRLRRDGECEI